MVILSIILGVLLLFALLIIYAEWKLAYKYYSMYMESNPDLWISEYFNSQAEEVFPCTLFLTLEEGADFDGSMFDFSEYETKKIIGLTHFRKEITENNKYYADAEGDPITAFIPNQKVLKMKDGSFQWDFTPLM